MGNALQSHICQEAVYFQMLQGACFQLFPTQPKFIQNIKYYTAEHDNKQPVGSTSSEKEAAQSFNRNYGVSNSHNPGEGHSLMTHLSSCQEKILT